MADLRPILVHIVSSRLWGGMERYALDICRSFASIDWEVNVFTRDTGRIDSMFTRAGVKVHHAPLSGYFDISTSLALIRFMRHREAPIVIHTHHYRDAFAALLARKLARKTPKQVRIVCTHHNCRAALEGRLMRRIYRNLDAFIFVSRLAARRFLSRWPHGRIPFSENKIHILHPFILHSDLPNLRPFPEKGPFSLLYLGRISPEKGIERLIRAMSLLKGKRIRLTIAGTGYADYVDSLHNLAIREGVDNLIDWKGWDDSPMERILDCHAGICVSPREEPFSLASLEMMACGRSQIIPPDGAFDEYMHPATIQDLQTEPLPPLTDSLRLTRISETTIAEAILTLAEQRHICTTLGQNALNNFRNLPTTSDAVTLLRKIYLNL